MEFRLCAFGQTTTKAPPWLLHHRRAAARQVEPGGPVLGSTCAAAPGNKASKFRGDFFSLFGESDALVRPREGPQENRRVTHNHTRPPTSERR